MYRHGDVLITKIDSIPKGTTKKKDNVLVYGESTGHAHRLIGGEIFTKGEAMFLNVKKGAKLVHEEHKTIELPKGKYSVIRQREYLTKDMTKVVVD